MLFPDVFIVDTSKTLPSEVVMVDEFWIGSQGWNIKRSNCRRIFIPIFLPRSMASLASARAALIWMAESVVATAESWAEDIAASDNCVDDVTASSREEGDNGTCGYHTISNITDQWSELEKCCLTKNIMWGFQRHKAYGHRRRVSLWAKPLWGWQFEHKPWVLKNQREADTLTSLWYFQSFLRKTLPS